jgi:hypothetical protein
VFPPSVLAPHVAVGILALLTFWGAALTRKGAPLHKLSGRAYLLALAPVLASVTLLALQAAAKDGPARLFQLVYLGLVVFTAAWTAWRAMRDKADVSRYRGPAFKLLAVLMMTSGAGLMAIGVVRDNVLTVGFSMLGIVYGGAMIGFLARTPSPGWHIDWHLNGVCLLFAATHASFIGIALRTLAPSIAGETLHVMTQLGTIAFAFGLRQVLDLRYGSGRFVGRVHAA